MAENCSPGVSQAMADSQVFNQKILQDSVMSRENQAALDNQQNARESNDNQRAWEAIKIDMAQIASRRAQNAATFDKAIDAAIIAAAATAQTENQQTVSPADTAASETTKGAVAAAGAGEAVSAETVTANVANLMTTLTPVIASSLATAISEAIAAILPVVVTASGGASTPSQTKAPAS